MKHDSARAIPPKTGNTFGLSAIKKMGLVDIPSCKNDRTRGALYLLFVAALFTLGILYETSVLQSQFNYGVWWTAFLVLVAISMFVIPANRLFDKLSPQWRSIAWNMSHVCTYFLMTFLAPKQWPFWLGIGVLWEYVECYTVCWSDTKIPIGCSGYFDVISNVAGVCLALALRQGILTSSPIRLSYE